ncbi:hypothetical protein [Achromobacter sp.]|uniref:hypothetical protein n=1 Tax=Achromobacter sp. TaxID=134375 RepID=UPI0028AFBD93|nr:hypothetical protein [Achromobacter sp.]
MSAQPFSPHSPVVSPRNSLLSPRTGRTIAALEAAQAPDDSLLARIWRAYCRHRNAARMRNLAAEMEPHMLDDVGAPQWLVNEITVQRDLERLRNVDYIRW